MVNTLNISQGFLRLVRSFTHNNVAINQPQIPSWISFQQIFGKKLRHTPLFLHRKACEEFHCSFGWPPPTVEDLSKPITLMKRAAWRGVSNNLPARSGFTYKHTNLLAAFSSCQRKMNEKRSGRNRNGDMHW